MANEANGVRAMATEARIKGVEHEGKLNSIADQLDALVAKRDAEIESLNQRLAASQAQTAEVSDLLGAEQQKNGKLEKAANGLQAEIAELTAALESKEKEG